MSAVDEIVAQAAAAGHDRHESSVDALDPNMRRRLDAIVREYRSFEATSVATLQRHEEERLPFLSRAIQTLIKAGPLQFQGEDARVLLDLLQEWLDGTAARRCLSTHRSVIYTMIRLAISSAQIPSALYVRGVDIGTGRVNPDEFGGFADIFTGMHCGRRVAVKRLRAHGTIKRDLFKTLCREALVWRQLKHRFILPFIGIDKETFASEGLPCLVSPWMERGTLKAYVDSADYQGSRDSHRILLEAAEGLEYLHAQKVVHGDLKDLNVLIDDHGHVQLCDFGLVVVGDTTAARMETTGNGIGTIRWTSPEHIVQGSRRRTRADDVYAYACLCYYMCTGHAPFHELNDAAVILLIIQGHRPEKPVTEQCTQELWSLVNASWSHDPSQRPTMTAILAQLRSCGHTPTPTDPQEGVATYTQEDVDRGFSPSLVDDRHEHLEPWYSKEGLPIFAPEPDHFRVSRLASFVSNPIDWTSEDDDERAGELFGPPRSPSLLHNAAPANMASGAMMDPFLNFAPASLGQPRAENALPSPSFSQAPSPMQTYSRSHHSPAFDRSMSGYGPSTRAFPPTTPHRASQIIDLTSTPSPPPSSVSAAALPPALSVDLPPETPVCIGQLQCNALVVHPIKYLQCSAGSEGAGETMDWVCVRAHYEHEAPKQQETIHLCSPDWRVGNFAVMEQCVATVLGPMLGKGLVRLEVRIRRALLNMPMLLPLVFLVFTAKGNIPIVGNLFQENHLMLDHPTSPFDPMKLANCYYHNPHNPPPGGFNGTVAGPAGSIVAGTQMARWTASQMSGKSVEVHWQRMQADELFKNLNSGDELGETEPPPEVKTKLYPHQNKAVTFMLEREREILQPGGKASSLWHMQQNPFSGRMSWQHLVTHKEVHEKPTEAKGAILADDMGMGKTLTCLALIASTLKSAQAFALEPLPPPIPPPVVANETFAKFHLTGKEQAKLRRESEAAADACARACRPKVKSHATLIVCPLSTISNWTYQFREHWAGQVVVVGGGGSVSPIPSAPAAGTPVTPSPGTPASALCSMGPLYSAESLLATDSRGHALPSMSNLAPPRNDVLPAMRNASVAHVQAAPTPFCNGQGPRPYRIYVYHGSSRRPEPMYLADFDTVITTFSTLATEFSRQCKSNTCEDDDDSIMEIDEHSNTFGKPKKGVKRKRGATAARDVASPLQSVCWFRVVLDEAHSIKETETITCQACCNLEADRRLCLTGTPVQNKLDDLFALIKFLRLKPFVDKPVWTDYIGSPVKDGQPIGFARLHAIMNVITLRRTKKTQADNGQKILTPPSGTLQAH